MEFDFSLYIDKMTPKSCNITALTDTLMRYLENLDSLTPKGIAIIYHACFATVQIAELDPNAAPERHLGSTFLYEWLH